MATVTIVPGIDRLISRKDACGQLGISLRCLDGLVAKGDLATVKIGAAVRIRAGEIARFIEVRETRQNPKRKGGAA